MSSRTESLWPVLAASVHHDDPYYPHDTRTVVAEALGVDFIPGSNFIIRADYENQNWANLFNNHSLTPRGFTISVGYDFKRHPG